MSHSHPAADAPPIHAPHGHGQHGQSSHGHAAHGHAAPGHASHGQASHGEDHDRRPWGTLALTLAAQIMVILDISVVNVALPSIGDALSFDSTHFAWVVSAYVLLSGGLLLLGGRLADLFDRRRVFLAGVTLFTAASLASAVAVSPLMLIVSRAAQGVGAAMLTPAALAIIVTTYSGRQRARALAAWGTVGSMGIAAGVLVGGALTAAFGWRAIFIINVPIGIAVAIATRRIVAAGRRTGHVRGLDLPGALTAVGGLLALVYAIDGASRDGWTSPVTIGALAVAAALLAAFAVIERRVPSPLIPPATWRARSLVSASVVMAVVTGVVVGVIFVASLYLQRVLGNSAIVTGLEFLPLALAITVGAAVGSHLMPRVGTRPLMVTGLVVMAAGAALISQVGEDPSYVADLLPGLVILGLGTGPMFVTIPVVAMSGVAHERSGLASGVMMTGHEVGAAIGVAALTTLVGDVTSRAGLIDGVPGTFVTIAAVLLALAVLAVTAVPRVATHATHGGMHGMH